jgi:predicted nuclease of predicted toxin-antitoxin system
MRFLVDAQLPIRLARYLASAGHDSLHTSELPDGNRTTDRQVSDIADEQSRAVITKDRDFRDSHVLRGSPVRLLVVSTGNITNTVLISLFERHIDAIAEASRRQTSSSSGRIRWWSISVVTRTKRPDPRPSVRTSLRISRP